MVGHDHRNGFIVVEFSAQAGDALTAMQQVLRSHLAERDNQLGFDQYDLPCQIGMALLGFERFRGYGCSVDGI